MYKGKFLSTETEDSVPVLQEGQGDPIPEELPAEPVTSAKTKPKKSTVLFYSIYGGCVMAVMLVLLYLMIPLNNLLVKFEASQPDEQAAEVYRILFENPDWGVIYTMAGVENTVYEGKEEFITYMTQKVGSQKLTFTKTADNPPNERTYLVLSGDEKIAAFSLIGPLNSQTEIVEWKLGEVTAFFSRDVHILIEKDPEHTVYINGVALDSSFTIRTTDTPAEDFLPNDVHSYRMDQQYVGGLLITPQILVVDSGGGIVPVEQDAQTGIYRTQLPAPAEITEEERQLVLDAAQAKALFAIRAITTGSLRKIFDPNSQAYADICGTDAFAESYASYAFDEAATNIYDFRRYNGEIFSARVTMQLNITGYDGSVKAYEMNTTYFFTLNNAGKYMVTGITDTDTTVHRERVRLAFLNGDTLIASLFVSAEDKVLLLPEVTPPEGQVLLGWARQEEDGTGMTIVFPADKDGYVAVTPEFATEPLTLYAIFGSSDEVTQ